MANITPTFELTFIGGGMTTTKDDWYEMSASGPDANSPIPSGKQIWLGYITLISTDKDLVFEIRPNLPTKSAGNTTDTQLRTFESVSASDGSKELDLYYYGNIMTLAPVSGSSTGVEKLWLRVRSNTQTIASFNYIVRYTLY